MRISRNAFLFCKFTITLLVWTAYIFKIKELLLLAFLLLAASALLTIKRAPLILLYSKTIDRIFPSPKTELNLKGIRFAHITGSILSGLSLVFIYLNTSFCWYVLLGFAILKTVSTAGFCPGEKQYSWMSSGGCCSLTKRC